MSEIYVAGLDVTFVHIPGETDDHIGVWLRERRIFLCGDDIYKAFPNLYAIRGTPTRDTLQWVESLSFLTCIVIASYTETALFLYQHYNNWRPKDKALLLLGLYPVSPSSLS